MDDDNDKILSFSRFFETIKQSQGEELDQKQQQVLHDLEAYGQQLQNELT